MEAMGDDAESEAWVAEIAGGPPSPIQTVSEIYPDDSASRRPMKTDTESSIGEVAEETSPSVVSFRTSDAEALYTVIGGRAFTSQSEVYIMPADTEEHRRLDLQHLVLSLSIDGLFKYRDSVDPLLLKGKPTAPQILDIGTGSGRWAVDMATTYPWAEVVGVDLVPPALISKEKVPSNCRFEIDDANLPMDHYIDTFDLVHARSVSTGLNDVHSFFYQVAKVVKPRGVFLPVDASGQVRDENLQPFPFVEPGEPGFTWLQYFLGHGHRAFWNRGCTSAPSSLWWKEWLDVNPNWTSVAVQNVDIPIGAWKEGMSDRETFAANLMRENVLNIFESWRRLLLDDGHKPDDVSLWINEGTKEVKEMRIRGHLRFMYFVAVRADRPWEDRGTWEVEDMTSRSAIKGVDLSKPYMKPQVQ